MQARKWFIKYSWATNLVLIAAVAYLWARAINARVYSMAAPARAEAALEFSPPKAHGEEYSPSVGSIVKRDLFQAASEQAEGQAGVSEGDTAEIKATSLRLKLTGIVYWGEKAEGNFATINDLSEQAVGLYRAGDEVTDGARLEEVKMDRVLLARAGGDLEELLLDDPEGKGPQVKGYRAGLERQSREDRIERIRKRRERQEEREEKNREGLEDKIDQLSETEFVIRREAMENAMKDGMNSLMTQARVIPNFAGSGDDRAVDGFRIYGIKPDSVYQYLGLLNGDVIKSINGQTMDDLEKALSLMSGLKTQTSFTVEIERKRRPLEMHYEVE